LIVRSEIKAKILDRKLSAKWKAFKYRTPLEEVRNQYGGPNLSDEELISATMWPRVCRRFEISNRRKEYLDAQTAGEAGRGTASETRHRLY
jgi:hypothetical protein